MKTKHVMTSEHKNSKPILFSTSMVQAILEGRKTQTRRIINTEFPNLGLRWGCSGWEDWHGYKVNCRYGKPGDTLYVRELHYAYGYWKIVGTTKTGKPKWKFIDRTASGCYQYHDTSPFPEHLLSGISEKEGWYKRNSLFMPKAAARIFLRVKNIRVEQLQDISEEDAKAEGVEPCYIADLNCNGEPSPGPSHAYRASFWDTWQSINGPDSWDQNPWVWVVEFERISMEIFSNNGLPV